MAYTKPIHTAQIHNCKYIHALVGTQIMRANKIQRKYAKFNISIQSTKTDINTRTYTVHTSTGAK